MADTAWSHQRIDRKGRDLEAFHQEVLAFATGDYLAALNAQASGALSAETRNAVAARLAAYTGLPAEAWASLKMSEAEFGRRLLADRGLQVGAYDSRYTLPLPQGFADPVADDPAMGRYVPGFVAAFHQMARQDLGVKQERPYGAIVWKDLLPAWNWNRAGVPPGQSYAADLATAMRRTPHLRVMVASGYFDLVTTSAAAEAAVREAGLPADRVTLQRYASGHMLYLGDTAEAFSNDVRAFIQAGTAAQSSAPPR
jgi:carboxypeptidase C (cathepsin A)